MSNGNGNGQCDRNERITVKVRLKSIIRNVAKEIQIMSDFHFSFLEKAKISKKKSIRFLINLKLCLHFFI